jgi:hypothetical protein
MRGSGRDVYTGISLERGLYPATRGLHVALTFLYGPSHDFGISQCEKGTVFLLLKRTLL